MPRIDRDKIGDKIVRRAQSAPRYLIPLNKLALSKRIAARTRVQSRSAPADMMPAAFWGTPPCADHLINSPDKAFTPVPGMPYFKLTNDPKI
jgi:hypothetical protein